MDQERYRPPGRRMRVLFATSELFPLAKTGGLGDVCAALPAALGTLGVEVRAILPGYISALDGARRKRTIAVLPDGGRLLLGDTPDTGLPVYLIDRPELFRRAGNPYLGPDKRDWPDNLRRFAAFSAAAATLALQGDGAGWQPDLVHANDWHTGLIMAFLALHGAPRPCGMFTIHNLAYQGNFPLQEARALGLPEALLVLEGAEFFGQLSCIKAGIRFADSITTVSPTYAGEILTPEHGAGLDGLLRARAADLTGILNGIDNISWNPAKDLDLPAPYDAEHLGGKAIDKAALRQELGLDPTAPGPLVIGVNRLTHQKMADVVADALPMLLEQGCQVALHGQGDRELEGAYVAAAAGHESCLAVRIGYQEALAHRMQAAADIALTPARFEPCGLTTMYAMRYGTLPVTRPVGGLADSVADVDAGGSWGRGPGFLFAEPTADALAAAVGRAGTMFHNQAAWRALQRRAMREDFGWARPARRYLALYRQLLSSEGRPCSQTCGRPWDDRSATLHEVEPVAA